MAELIRISAEEVRRKVTSGSALLVCSYDDEEKCKSLHLEGSISLTEFKSKLSGVAKDQEIIFYCA
ncbi:MAG: ArsR family transcriptional regulator [Proteobacteria bacterium]|nr:ArsR family transcriptional regulator [Pseudomonadota bacterium]